MSAIEEKEQTASSAVVGGDLIDPLTDPSRTKTPSSSSKRARKPKRNVADNNNTKRKPSALWPEVFKQLSQTHRALNLVYTFCCTRKHLATTFETIKTTVQAQMGGRELTVEDVARIKVLIPRAVRFEFVDEGVLEVLGVGDDTTKEGGGKRDEYKLMNVKSASLGGGFIPEEHIAPTTLGDAMEDGPPETKDVLLFEFVDEDLRRQVQHSKTGEPTRPTKRLRNDELKLPVYSQKQMLNLIEKRNKKFSDAIDAFLVKCEDEGTDPVEHLESEKVIPLPPAREEQHTQNGARGRKLPDEIPKERKPIAEIITDIKKMDWYTAQIVPDGHRVFDPQPAVYGDLHFRLSQNLVNALYNVKGITRFYSHQAEAINNLYDGHHVIVSTSTSSGKSLIYQVPMLHELERDPNSRGIYIFPTKALAQDQRRSMKELLNFMEGLDHVIVETFDGDTPMNERNTIRDEGRIIFTNPDMLHVTILPQEGSWRTFLQNLKFVVVDELHAYNGLFGSHVAFVMRRLRRICAAVGNRRVRFISCSATVANPEEHMKTIFGVDDVRLTDFDGSPAGRKEFICWNTPFKDPHDPTSGRGDSIAEAARLFCQLVLRGVRVILFCRIRKQCEIVLAAVRTEFQTLERPEVANLVMGYRGGYSPQDRRQIEKEMFDGKLMGVVATNALELGVDIGSLDAVITLGFPFSISNLRQQSGRAGRRNKDSLSVLIGDGFPTDQHYMSNPDEIFTKPNCELQVDLTNELVLEGHVQCAAFEMPLKPEEDKAYFGEQLEEFASTRLIKDALGYYHCNERFRPKPSDFVSLRDMEGSSFAVVDTTHNRNIVLEEVETSRAFFTIYEGGIFMHQGQTYIVRELNPEKRLARVVQVQVDWNTQQRDYTDIDPIETEAIRHIGPSARAYYGIIQIHAVVYGFFKIDKRGRVLDAVQVDNPPIDTFTKGMWLDVPKRAFEILESRRLNIAAAIHAAEHAVLSLFPTKEVNTTLHLRIQTSSTRSTTVSKPSLADKSKYILEPPRRQRPARLTFYDTKGGPSGSGIALKAFEFIDSLLSRAIRRIEACACITPQGCIECVCDERCKERNVVMSKAGAVVVLKCLLGRESEIDIDALPWGEEYDVSDATYLHAGEGEIVGGYETVVLAREVRVKDGVRIYP
ncbi:DEAD/DEAH box helicase, putative [Talaromyces stipitatus ATCC 10500]|uniref:DEAD/DEAH box helicase, putative n=1 Tax=Talaromyces stipitatus (strain ATCC 10500 / CBS 375.48 / QM 6759 / NRRL 1006) TaxID=441959 RepID=B8M8Q7_TALSN|nr:DEAD/DEAH box helicase, putative [Talaromyces stipitatus ATCC 10500]EED20570.1 DEAD/DEAH box helicase, putative [Talaromyces stipitatus ATCC 10500]